MKTTNENNRRRRGDESLISLCPFCGSEANLRNDSYPATIAGQTKMMPWFIVQCVETKGALFNDCGAWQSGPTEEIAIAKWNRRSAKPFPQVMGRELTREEVMEGLRDGYKSMVTLAKQEDPSTVGFPDMETLLTHIEEHGIPPKSAVNPLPHVARAASTCNS